MKLEKILTWLDRTLRASDFDDVSNNGLQIEVCDRPITTVAFAVDASVSAVEAAAKAEAELLVVHHGISWGGGIRRIAGGVGAVVRAAIGSKVAVAAYHLPLDAHPTLGNNAQIAKLLKLGDVRPAFRYHGNVIGLTGVLKQPAALAALGAGEDVVSLKGPLKLGVCSGGAGEFAEEAKRLGCDLYLTGEANWGDVIAAENCGMKMICAGHYETEVFGISAVARAMARELTVKTATLAAGC